MKNLIEYDQQSILSEEVFIEVFEQEDVILQARMLLSLQDRAKELGVKQKFDDLVKAYKSVDKERRKSRASKTMLDQWTNFTGPYDNMMCGAWVAGDDGIRTFSKDYSNEVLACYHPILPVKRMKNLETELPIRETIHGKRLRCQKIWSPLPVRSSLYRNWAWLLHLKMRSC